MRTEYDVSTKDKEMSYKIIVDKILEKLGFRPNISGTKLLRELIVYLYIKDPFTIDVKKEIIDLIKQKNINISYDNYIKRIQYTIENANIAKMNKYFVEVFKIDFDYCYLKTKILIVLIFSYLKNSL